LAITRSPPSEASSLVSSSAASASLDVSVSSDVPDVSSGSLAHAASTKANIKVNANKRNDFFVNFIMYTPLKYLIFESKIKDLILIIINITQIFGNYKYIFI